MKFTAILYFVSACIISACGGKSSIPGNFSISEEFRVDSLPGSCPYFTSDAAGNTVLSWIREVPGSDPVFCYAVADGERTYFGQPIEIPVSTNIQPHAENIPKLAFKPSGEILAVWGSANPGQNKYAGLVFYAQSFDAGKSWTSAKRLVQDTSANDQRYFDLAIMKDGEAAIIWLDNRTREAKDGAALYFAKTDGKNGFVNEQLISEPTCECCRVELFVDSRQSVHAIYRGILQDSIRDILHISSDDQGNSFSKPVKISDDQWTINACPHTGPSVTESGNSLHFSWYSMGGGAGIYYTRSPMEKFSYQQRVSVSGKTGRHPQIAALDDSNTVIVWDETNLVGDSLITKIRLRIGAETETNPTYELSPEASNAVYPVLSVAKNKGRILVAYTNKSGSEKYIAFRQMYLND